MTITLMPPYAGPGWSNYTDITRFAAIWVAYRHKPLNGEIVMQMGSSNFAGDFQLGMMKIGFQHTFKATVNGLEQIVVDVNPGPISRRGNVRCLVGAHLKGPGVDSPKVENVYSYRPTSILVAGNLWANATYTLTFNGYIDLSVDGGETAYGEIITRFPKVTRFGPAAAVAGTEVPEAATDPRLAELKREEPVLTEISLEEAIRAGAEGFHSDKGT
jgi:hypothetical protein